MTSYKIPSFVWWGVQSVVVYFFILIIREVLLFLFIFRLIFLVFCSNLYEDFPFQHSSLFILFNYLLTKVCCLPELLKQANGGIGTFEKEAQRIRLFRNLCICMCVFFLFKKGLSYVCMCLCF